MSVKPSSHQVVAVAEGPRGNERLKRPEILNMNGNTTILRHQCVTCMDITSFYKIETLVQLFVTCILLSESTVLGHALLKQLNSYKMYCRNI